MAPSQATHTRRRGAEAIEFALTAPVMFLMILGAMEYGWYFCHDVLLQSATEHAARAASLQITSDVELPPMQSKAWHIAGRDAWNRFGLPGEAGFTSTLEESGGVWVVSVTGAVGYDALLPTAITLGSGGWSPLASDLSHTVAKRVHAQDLNQDVVDVVEGP